MDVFCQRLNFLGLKRDHFEPSCTAPTVLFEDNSGAQLIQDMRGHIGRVECKPALRTRSCVYGSCRALAPRRASEVGADLALDPAAPLGSKPWKRRSRLARGRGAPEVRGLNPLSSTRKSPRARGGFRLPEVPRSFNGLARPIARRSSRSRSRRSAARYTAAADTPAVYAYSDNYLVDLKNAVIMDAEATTAVRPAEVGAAKTVLDRTAERLDVTPSRLVADAGYGSAEMVGWLVDERGIDPHVKLMHKSERTDGTFSRSDFAYDPESNVYVCPGGKELKKYHRAFSKPRAGPTKDGTLIYFARKQDCDACALKPKCCPNIPRGVGYFFMTVNPACSRYSRCLLTISTGSVCKYDPIIGRAGERQTFGLVNVSGAQPCGATAAWPTLPIGGRGSPSVGRARGGRGAHSCEARRRAWADRWQAWGGAAGLVDMPDG